MSVGQEKPGSQQSAAGPVRIWISSTPIGWQFAVKMKLHRKAGYLPVQRPRKLWIPIAEAAIRMRLPLRDTRQAVRRMKQQWRAMNKTVEKPHLQWILTG